MSHSHVILIMCDACHIPMSLRVVRVGIQYVCLVLCFVRHVIFSCDSHHMSFISHSLRMSLRVIQFSDTFVCFCDVSSDACHILV